MIPRIRQMLTHRRWLAIATSTAVISVGSVSFAHSSAQAEFTDPHPSQPPSDVVTSTTGRYVPPDRSAPSQGQTVPGTTRGEGCSASGTTGLVPLAPIAHVGQTQSSQPTIAWFTPETEDYTMEFRLAEYLPDGSFDILYETEFPLTENTLPSGITVVSLQDTEVMLTADQTYRWQAVLVCNPNRPSESLVAEADLYVVEPEENLVAAVAEQNDAVERANLYAVGSLWYDALAEVLEAEEDETKTVQLSLLNDLALLEAADSESANSSVTTHGDRLRAVIETIETEPTPTNSSTLDTSPVN